MPHRSSSHGHHSHGHSGSKKHALKVERVVRISLFFCEYKVSSFRLIRKTHFKSFFQIQDKISYIMNRNQNEVICACKAVRTTISRDFLQNKISVKYVNDYPY